jgi:hypothetical protein
MGFLFKVVCTVSVPAAQKFLHETVTSLRNPNDALPNTIFNRHEHSIWASRFVELLNHTSGPILGGSLVERSFWAVLLELYNVGHISVAEALYYERTGDTYPEIRSLQGKGLLSGSFGFFSNFPDGYSTRKVNYDWKTGLSECLEEDEVISFCQLINGYKCIDKQVPYVILSSLKSASDFASEPTLVFVPYSNRIIRSEQYKKIIWACGVKNLGGGSLGENTDITKLRFSGSINSKMFPYLCGPAETLSADVAQQYFLT